MRLKEITKAVEVEISESEKMTYARMMAEARNERDETAATAKRVAKGYKETIEAIEEKMACLGKAILTGKEDRPMRCIWEADFRIGTKQLIRTDTFEVIASEVLTDAERQLEFKTAEKEPEKQEA